VADSNNCPACGGTGTCSRCGGSGGGDSPGAQCPACHGTGDCDRCGGEGVIPEEDETQQRVHEPCWPKKSCRGLALRKSDRESMLAPMAGQ
jgi:hypothetical protein